MRLTHSYAGAIKDRAGFMTIAMCSFCKRFIRSFKAFNDGRETDPFLPVRQHDAAIKGRQLQG